MTARAGAPLPCVETLERARIAARDRLTAGQSELAAIVASAAGANGDDEHDPEGSTIAFERSRTAALTARAAHELAELDEALARLGAGGYGRCERCGGEIDPERLRALPATRTCIGCAGAARRARIEGLGARAR